MQQEMRDLREKGSIESQIEYLPWGCQVAASVDPDTPREVVVALENSAIEKDSLQPPDVGNRNDNDKLSIGNTKPRLRGLLTPPLNVIRVTHQEV